MTDQSDKNAKTLANSDVVPPVTGRRIWVYRAILSLLLPALILGGLEAALRGGSRYVDPAYFKTSGQRAIVRDNPRFSWQFFPATIARSAPAMSFAARKPTDTIRIFVLGASAAQGDPEPSFGFSRILQFLLSERYPDNRFEVINTAITATNSHVVLPIAREVAGYEPDLVLIYLGNNEVVGPYGAGSVFWAQSAGVDLVRAQMSLRRTALGQLVSGAASSGESGQWGGMEMFLDQQLSVDDPTLAGIYANYGSNLRDIIKVFDRSSTPVVVSTVAVNLRHCGPFASVDNPDMSAVDRENWLAASDVAAVAAAAGDWKVVVGELERAAALDSSRADLHFRWARALDHLGYWEQARYRYEQALQRDALRFRADQGIAQVISEVGAELAGPSVAVVDVAGAVASASPAGIPGRELFVDHVHFNFQGHDLVARTFLPAVEAQLGERLGKPAPGPLPTAADVADRLARTGFDEARVTSEMIRRLARAPFTNQFDHSEQVANLEDRRTELRFAAVPRALAAMDSLYASAINGWPEDLWLHRNRARFLADRQRWAEAAAELERFVTDLPQDAPAQDELAGYLAQAGQFAEAVAVGENLRRDWPDLAQPRYTLAYAYSRLGKYDESLTVYDELLALDSRAAADIHNAVGRLEAGRNRPSAAVAAFERAVATAGRAEEAELPDIVYNLSQMLRRMGRVDEAGEQLARAVELYEAALQENPESIGILSMLGRLGQERGLLKSAERYYEKILRLDPCHAGALRGTIQALVAQGKPKAAREIAQRGLENLERCGDLAGVQELKRYLQANP